ncbi:MAG: TrmB family transcriptional regulator [Candidatus Thorarchaeota archaeon]
MKETESETAIKELEDTLIEIERKIKSFKILNLPQVDWQLYALLRRLGLTKYEIQAYIALVSMGPQTISQLTGSESKTGIPQPRAYDVLGSLVKYGLVEECTTGKMKRRTKIFRAIPPKEGLNNLMTFFLYAKDKALSQLETLMLKEESSYGGIWEISSKEYIVRAAKRVIKRAQYEILIVGELNFLKKIIPTIKSIQRQKQILVSIITKSERNGQVEEILEWIKFSKIRYRPAFSMGYIVVDRLRALQWTRNMSIGQEIENIEVIHTLIDHFFFSNWHLGRSLTDIYNKGLQRRYPLTTINIQTAIDEIEFLFQQNHIPYVEVSGTIITTGKKKNLKGKVIRSEKNWGAGTFSIIMNSNGKEWSVGGMLASIEDITADAVIIDYEH